MTDLVLLPDAELLVVSFFLDQPEITDFFTAGVNGAGSQIDDPPTDRVYTDIPKLKDGTPNPVFPLVRVSRFGGAPVRSRPAWLDQAAMQIEAYGGGRKTARQLAETCRALLDLRLPGVHAEGVVTNVRTQSFAYHPDDTYKPAKPKFDFVAVITAHPNRDGGS